MSMQTRTIARSRSNRANARVRRSVIITMLRAALRG